MAFIVYDYQCVECGVREPKTVERDEVTRVGPQMIPCWVEGCDGIATKQLTPPNFTKASYVDGHKRFTSIKETRKLDKVIRKARQKGDSKTAIKAQQEKARIK